MEVSGIVCPKCDGFVWSRHRHDFRRCLCGYCYVDGGQEDYTRIGYGDGYPREEWEQPVLEIREVTLSEEDKELVNYQPRFPY